MGKYRLILIVLMIAMILSSIYVYADEISIDYKNGYNEGVQKGKSDGTFTGNYDAQNKTNTMRQTLESNIDDYERELNLKGRSKDYIDGFKTGYETAFKEAYYAAYRLEDKETILIYGAEDFGTIMGRIDGYIAYNSGNKNNWERYVPSDRKLSDMFELNRESREYRNGFIEGFRRSYKLSFEAAFQVAKLGEKHNSYEQGLEDGDEYARDLAELNGRKDYLLGLSNDYRRNIPSDKEIIDMFNLNNESNEYKDAFLAGFEFGKDIKTTEGKTDGGYMLYYNEAYRRANKESIETPDLNGEEGGRTIGRMKGEYAAIIDITLGKSNSWTGHKVDDKNIVDEYGLQFQSENYRDAFIIGYWDEFMKSYNETYKKLQQDSNRVKTHTEKISIDGKNNIGIPEDDKFLVDIEAGTYYNDVIVTIDSIPTSYVNPNSSRHTQASGVYGLKIMNLEGTFDKNKKITIKFKSYGKDVKYGIYKYHYNKWIYIPSKQDGDYLVADINLNNISLMGNIYAVRVDNELPIFHESRGHWAKDEINTYVKREIIYGYPDKSFRPDKEVSRGEFVTMLSRLYDWYPPYDSTNVTQFKDYKEFGYAEKAISYATYYKIVNGYSDNTFRPHNPITYKEVEIIMSRVLNDKGIKWDYFADRMLYEKKIRSSSKDSMNNKITRAEFTFLLHQLNEWQY
ncbi:S-layer homology domain-containing protein [uncultured Tissierella sp.]|uniref:S-layer homology domain-containing protein n=1 Tax=uncultured Tissierella sp. TaxID=448160 RepID=UPI00280641A4|nr:S-layer homology domain-containing protein [uncultured Tissierella sp.]MDU5080040.1 S-layer homology domain-containing protein [Bacillota bacterium]